MQDRPSTDDGTPRVSGNHGGVVSNAASGLAAMLLVSTIRDGHEVTFPSLGIKLGLDDLTHPGPTTDDDHS